MKEGLRSGTVGAVPNPGVYELILYGVKQGLPSAFIPLVYTFLINYLQL